MTNEQIKNLLEKALQRSKNPVERGLGHNSEKLVIQIELIISMLENEIPVKVCYTDPEDMYTTNDSFGVKPSKPWPR